MCSLGLDYGRRLRRHSKIGTAAQLEFMRMPHFINSLLRRIAHGLEGGLVELTLFEP